MARTIYTTCNPITEFCALFQNNGRTIPAEAGVYWDGTNCWEVDSNGIVIAQGSCTTTTTTTTTTSTTTTTTTAAGNEVSIYSRAGGNVTTDEYNLFYSQDNVNWNSVVSNASSTLCTFWTTATISSGTIYLKAERSSNSSPILIKGANSTTCPANGSPAGTTCTYSVSITGNTSVAITVWFDAGTSDYSDC